MTKEEIEESIALINEIRGDDEMAHGKEDALHLDFIGYVAKRKDSLGTKARLILTTEDIDFARWCA